MGYHEQIWLEEFKTCEVVLYPRYVDDIICLFASEKDANEFFTFVNSRQPYIKFTLEKEKHNKIAFLDICVNKTSHSFCTSVFQNSTSIGLYTNFLRFTCFSYKIGLIKNLTHRTYAASSSWNFFHDEIKNTKHLLEKNMNPPYLIYKKVKLFLDFKMSKNDTPKNTIRR